MAEHLLITEDNQIAIFKGSPTQLDLKMCDDGLQTIIRLKDMCEYFEGDWIKIERCVLDADSDPTGPFHTIAPYTDLSEND